MPQAALRGLHVEVFEVEAGLGEEGREVGEEQRERDDVTVALRHQRLDDGFAPEELRPQLLGRDLQQVRELLELGQFADQADDGRDVALFGGAQREGWQGRHPKILAPRAAPSASRATDSADRPSPLQCIG